MLDILKEQVVAVAKEAERLGMCRHKSGNFSIYDPETGYGMYWDLNDHLYVLGSVGSVARPFQWDFETAEIVEQAEDRIAIEADASLVESWRDTLVLVREDGIWRLTDSYYAQQE